jgi:DNA-binding NarL/FixJ family response regulator
MTLTVLIVDDDPDFRRLARRMLSSSGVEVISEAATVGSARTAAIELRPDAALVDVCLPDGNGIELARELAELDWSPRIVLTSTDAGIAGDDVERGIVFVPKADLPTAPLLKLMETRV